MEKREEALTRFTLEGAIAERSVARGVAGGTSRETRDWGDQIVPEVVE